jgi:hypothetical protein
LLARWFPDRWCSWIALAVILLVAVLRIGLLLLDTGLDLSPDEAHYWDWSRNLDWSYYSKGPLVAWIIRASCEFLGPLSLSLTGALTFAVRAPAVLFGSLMLGSLYVLTVQVSESRRLGLLVVLGAITHPIVTAGSTLITIDSPYACAWGWASVLALHAIRTPSLWAWLLAGLIVGLGILAKYTMAVFLPSVALYLLLSPRDRGQLATAGPWLMVGVASLACVPILLWNSQHDWVTVQHLLQLAGLGPRGHDRAPGGFKLLGPINYIGGQFALMLGTWFVLWAAAVFTYAPWRDDHPGRRYLWCLSVPMFAVFLAFSPKTGGGELNWPITAFLTGSVLAAIWYVSFSRPWIHGVVAGTCALGLSASVFLYISPALHPLMELAVGKPTATNPTPMRKLDPTCRLRGWRELARQVDAICAEVRAEGEEPVLVGTGWTLPGQLGVYGAGNPRVYCIGSLQGERLSQYDLWHNPIDHPADFLGRTFVIVGYAHASTLASFETVSSTHTIRIEVAGRPISEFTVWVCRGFRGFGPRPEAKH